MYKCSCGQEFPRYGEFRLHIALQTKDWPLRRCNTDHYDPGNEGDLMALRWLKTAEKDDPE